MSRAITTDTTTSGRGVSGVMTLRHPAAGYVIHGTRPHVIVPRRGRALRFQAGGRTVFAARVNHPGNRPNNFLAEAVSQTR